MTATASFGLIQSGREVKNLANSFTVAIDSGAPQSKSTLSLQIPGQADVDFEVTIEDEEILPQDIAIDLVLGNTKTWMISGITTVVTGTSLTVRPGTTIKFEEDARMEVFGELSSVGTSESPIQWLNHMPPPITLFAPSFELPVGDHPGSVAMGDVTGDGVPDIVTTESGSYPDYEGTVNVLTGDGTGGFAPQMRFPVGNWPLSVALGDVTGDGMPDIVTADNGLSPDFMGTVNVLAGDGTGGFAPQARFPVGKRPACVALGDVTGDGVPDIVTR